MAKPNNVVVMNSSRNDRRDCIDDFDFVLVEKNFEGNTTDHDNDADSYDYCEDFCSMISDRSRQENDGDIYLSSEGIDDVSTSPLTCLKDLALSVPLVLLKDLDEAHEAAKLTQINHLDGMADLITTCSDDEYVVEADGESLSSSKSQINSVLEETESEKAGKLKHSQSRFSSSLNKDIDDPAIISDLFVVLSTNRTEASYSSTKNIVPTSKNIANMVMPAITTDKKPTSIKITATKPCFPHARAKVAQEDKKQKEKQFTDGKNSNKSNTGNRTAPVRVSISRASNKKRRKRLKLLKKAQAAEKFKKQATFSNLSPPLQDKISQKPLKRSKTKLRVTSSPRASKKVVNIAVSCAIDSISSYRKELRRQQGMQ